jgi:hypothetical protein
MDTSVTISVIAVLLAALGYYENRRGNTIQLRQAVALEESNRIALGQGNPPMPASPRLAFVPNRWPLVVLAILLAMNLAVTGFSYYDRHYRNPIPHVFQEYQAESGPWPNTPRTCNVTLNGNELMASQSDYASYHVILVCGIVNPTVDRLESSDIKVSEPFTISSGTINIVAPYSQAMLKNIAQHIKDATATTPKGHTFSLGYPVWYQVALVPNTGTCKTADIRRLSDIPQCGGQLLPEVASQLGFAEGVVQ